MININIKQFLRDRTWLGFSFVNDIERKRDEFEWCWRSHKPRKILSEPILKLVVFIVRMLNRTV